MPEDLVLTVLKEMRSEASAFREETHNNFGTVFHRLSVAEAHMADVRHRLASLETRLCRWCGSTARASGHLSRKTGTAQAV
jgi:hypothetical protein